jgi:hypothetical protein
VGNQVGILYKLSLLTIFKHFVLLLLILDVQSYLDNFENEGYRLVFDIKTTKKNGMVDSGSSPGVEGACRRMHLEHEKLLLKTEKQYTPDQLLIERVDDVFQTPLKMLTETLANILKVIPASNDLFNENFHNFTYARMNSLQGGCRQELHTDHCPLSKGNKV